MRCGPLFVCIMPLMLYACSDLAMNPSVFDGTFYGTFTITNNMGVEETGAVTFTFSGDKYRCIPEKKYLPPGGGGLFKTIGQALVLNDTMTHTAEFDHTLILNGAFSYTYDGSHLVLYQDDQQYLRFRRIDLTRQ